jgi:UDP-N-acetyl-D-mannosaminuronic acid dehydrogenase
VWKLIFLANRHPRVKILQPGPGVGGHCIAVDPWFIVDAAPEEARLIRTAREVNDAKPDHVLDWIKSAAARFPRPVIACLGLTFKADVDDLRESPSAEIVKRLAHEGVGEILAVEPHIRTLPAALAQCGVKLVEAAAAVGRADIVVLLVNHKAFGAIERRQLEGKVLIDTRGYFK